MRYFQYLTEAQEKDLFFKSPEHFDRFSDKRILANAIGPLLYMPATRSNIVEEIISNKNEGLIATAICLEDAIGDNEVAQAEQNLASEMVKLMAGIRSGVIEDLNIPLIFIRVRSPQQIKRIAELLGENLYVITGFILSKCNEENGPWYLDEVRQINCRDRSRSLYAMPILETPDVIYKESRLQALVGIKRILDENYDQVLNVRIGATDFSSLFGIRRGSDVTIYDIGVIRDCIADIVNVFGRADKGYVISGPVWEYFTKSLGRVLKPQLRQTPFEAEFGATQGVDKRKRLLDQYLDGLVKEVLLDKANGLQGKTIIHPSHIKPVQALNIVSLEEYLDASSILSNDNGNVGVLNSKYGNKMNEIKPHTNWANMINTKAKIYGVLNENHNFTSLL